MKKITYLVAPLMVLPFLVGCNKGNNCKVVDVVGKQLAFTTMDGKDLKTASFSKGKDFQFKVSAINADGSEDKYSIEPTAIGIYVGEDASFPLFDGYNVEFTKEDMTEATVTIQADHVTGDISINAIAAKEGSYIYYVPVMLGVSMYDGADVLGWKKIDEDAEFNFNGITDEYAQPGLQDFLISVDGSVFDIPDGSNIKVEKDTGRKQTKLTITSNVDVEDFVVITARAGAETSFLDSLSWDEIKELSVNGYAPYLFDIGEEKTVNVKVDEVEVPHKVRIIGFDHDLIAGQETTAGITFQFSTAISDAVGAGIKRAWNKTLTAADFEASSLNKALKEELMPMLPEDLQKNMETVTKKVGKYKSSSWNPVDYQTQLFPLSVEEVKGTNEELPEYCYYVKGEGTQYPYFANGNVGATPRSVTDAQGNAIGYWLRSPNDYGTTGVADYIASNGAFCYEGAYVTRTTLGVAPAFCI